MIFKKIEKPSIRNLKKSDITGIKELVEDLYDEEVKMSIHKLYKREDKWVRASLAGMEKGNITFLVAEVSGEIVGFCNVIKQNREGWLGIAVRRDFRNKKIGRKLLNKALKKAGEMGVKHLRFEVFSNNKKSLDFFSNYEFSKQETIRNKVTYKGRPVDVVVLTKSL